MPGKYPVAARVVAENERSSVACAHCREPIAVPAWDKWNGFLLECPWCHGFHGRPWNTRGIAFASFVLNAFSFFFTMRPARAVVVIALWAVLFWLLLPRTEGWPDGAQATVFIVLMLGPLLVNMALLVRHQMDLDRHPVNLHPRQGG